MKNALIVAKKSRKKQSNAAIAEPIFRAHAVSLTSSLLSEHTMLLNIMMHLPTVPRAKAVE